MAEPGTMSPVSTLSNLERADLDQLEGAIDKGRATFEAVHRAKQTIKRGYETFRQVTAALLEIHRRQLYRAEFPDFLSYCKKRWHLSRSRIYQLLGAGKLIESREAQGLAPPRNESQARRMIYGDAMPIAAARTPLEELDEEDDEIENDVADRASRQRPGLAMTARVEKLLAQLRKINAKHPWRTRADELLDLYEATVLPWPAE